MQAFSVFQKLVFFLRLHKNYTKEDFSLKKRKTTNTQCLFQTISRPSTLIPLCHLIFLKKDCLCVSALNFDQFDTDTLQPIILLIR